MAQTATKRQASAGSERHFSRNDFSEHFDKCAQELVRLSGKEALKRIESGTADYDAAWTELKLMAPLVKAAK
jgi:hypothetical protein